MAVNALISAFIVFFLIAIICRIAGYDFRIVHSGGEIGILSHDSKYELVEMTDDTGRYLLYTIVQPYNSKDPKTLDSGPQTRFVTDDFWYAARYISAYGWKELMISISILQTPEHMYITMTATRGFLNRQETTPFLCRLYSNCPLPNSSGAAVSLSFRRLM